MMIEERLKGGASGAFIYRIKGNNRALIKRVLPITETLESVDREFYITKLMGDLGVAPKVHFLSIEDRTIVMDEIQGDHLWGPRLTDTDLYTLGKLLRQIHSTPADSFSKENSPRDLVFEALYATENPIHNLSDTKAHRLEQCLRLLESRNYCITHTDLHSGNILRDTDGLKIIDWQEVTRSHPYIDLASIIVFFVHNERELGLFLKSYSEGVIKTINWPELQAAVRVYNLILYARLMRIANRMNRSNDIPTSRMTECYRHIVLEKDWKRMISMLSDRKSVVLFAQVFLEESRCKETCLHLLHSHTPRLW